MIWFAEAYRWVRGTTWLSLINPLTREQRMTVTFLSRPDVPVQYVTVPARSRVPMEVGDWVGLKNGADFGLEVACASVCAAGLVMWDDSYKIAHESIPVVGCVTR